MIIGCVDVVSESRIHGWVADQDDLNRRPTVTLLINGEKVRTTVADLYRADLVAAGLGDGCHAFELNARPYISLPENRIELLADGRPFDGRDFSLYVPDVASPDHGKSVSINRWSGEEDDPGLTWGAMMSGDTFFDAMNARRRCKKTDRILEVGPGYGRLLDSFIEKVGPPKRYVGVEMSQSRVDKLSLKYEDKKRYELRQGDATEMVFDEEFDVFMCSSTFEHLYPDCSQTLLRVYNALVKGGYAFIDFIHTYDDRSTRQFEPKGNAYLRIYSHAEILKLFERAGFSNIGHAVIGLGQDDQGREILRHFISAKK